MLTGGGDYVISAIRDITVTEEFLGLDRAVTKCQMEEYRADCLTRTHRQVLKLERKWKLPFHGLGVIFCSFFKHSIQKFKENF